MELRLNQKDIILAVNPTTDTMNGKVAKILNEDKNGIFLNHPYQVISVSDFNIWVKLSNIKIIIGKNIWLTKIYKTSKPLRLWRLDWRVVGGSYFLG